MVIAMACNKEWYKYLVVNLYSLLESNKNIKKIYLLLETDNVFDVLKLNGIIEKYSVDIELINFNLIFDNLVEKGNINSIKSDDNKRDIDKVFVLYYLKNEYYR